MNIRSIIYLAIAAATTASFISCDSNASDIVHTEQNGMYNGSLDISLYTPDVEVEQANTRFFEENRINIPTSLTDSEHFKSDSVYCKTCLSFNFLKNSNIDFVATNDYSISLGIKTTDTIMFAIPYLDKDGEVRDIYRDGKFAQLFEGLKKAVADGYVADEKFQAFKDQVSVIHDTIIVPSLYTSVMEADEHGAALITYNHEWNSYYTKFDFKPTKYQRMTNLLAAINTIQSDVMAIYKDGKLSAETLEMLKKIETGITGGELTDGKGWCIASIANYNLNAELQLQEGTGLLDNLAKALYGTDSQGNALKELWLIIKYHGTFANKTDLK